MCEEGFRGEGTGLKDNGTEEFERRQVKIGADNGPAAGGVSDDVTVLGTGEERWFGSSRNNLP